MALRVIPSQFEVSFIRKEQSGARIGWNAQNLQRIQEYLLGAGREWLLPGFPPRAGEKPAKILPATPTADSKFPQDKLLAIQESLLISLEQGRFRLPGTGIGKWSLEASIILAFVNIAWIITNQHTAGERFCLLSTDCGHPKFPLTIT